MEKTYKRVPFDLELAKDIQTGKVEGRIKCNEREFHRILCFDAIGLHPVVALLYDGVDEVAFSFSKNGCFRSLPTMKLYIELPEEKPKSLYIPAVKDYKDGGFNLQDKDILEETPKHDFEPFDKVLVKRNGDYGDTLGTWTPAFFQKYVTAYGKRQYLASGLQWHECIPYEGNEHLVGTTNNPQNK